MTTKKTQHQLFSEMKILALDMPWNDIAAHVGIIPRTFKNYRMPDTSSNHRKMDAATSRRVMKYIDGLIEHKGSFTLEPLNQSFIDNVDQKEMFTKIKSLAGEPSWNDLADSLDFNYRTFETYRLPSESVHYRKTSPLALMELFELINRLAAMKNEGKSPEERWESIKDSAFEKVNISRGISRHVKKAKESLEKTKAKAKEKAKKTK